MESEALKLQHWRKSGQLVTLTRQHAQLIVDDSVVSELFKKWALSMMRTSSKLPSVLLSCTTCMARQQVHHMHGQAARPAMSEVLMPTRWAGWMVVQHMMPAPSLVDVTGPAIERNRRAGQVFAASCCMRMQ